METRRVISRLMHDLGEPVVVVLDAQDGQLQLVVSGRDRGGLPLGHMRDRVEAAGGSLSITGEDSQAVIEVRAPVPVAVSRSNSSTPAR